MEKIVKAHTNTFQIPKNFMDYLDCENNNLVRWEINQESNVVKFSCVNSNDFPNKVTDNFYVENDTLVLYRSLYKQGATSFPVIVRKFMNFQNGNFIKWSTNDNDEVIIENIERKRLIDLSGIVKEK